MGAKNKVISGEYEGRNIYSTSKYAVIPLGFINKVILDENTIDSYKLIDGNKKTSATSAIGRGAVGSLVLGPVGLLAGLSAKKKGIYTIAINFKDGKQSLIEVDEKIYEKILKLSLVNLKNNTNIDIQSNNEDIPEQIRKLAKLKDDGILTEEEFLAKKTELLNQI